MNQGPRVAIEYFLPPLLTSLPFAVPGMRDPELSSIAVLFVSVAVGFMGAGIPSLVSTFILERAFARGLSPKDKKAVGLSAFLGLLSGAGVSLVFMGGHDFVLMTLVGLGAWTATGLVVFSVENYEKRKRA